MDVQELLDEIDKWYSYANEVSDTTTIEGMEQYRLMQQCIEQYRREMCKGIFKERHAKPIPYQTMEALGQWEIHLNLHWTLPERLLQILENEWNFLAYIYR
jgi:hypothetical protein